MIRFENIGHRYKNDTVLENINLILEEDKIYGLLGRNGVGKTTLMSLLAGARYPTEGEIFMDEEKIWENPEALMQIAYIPDSLPTGKEDSLKIKDRIELASLLYPNWDDEFCARLLHVFKLEPKSKVNKLSKGQQTALGLVLGLASRAPLTIFDEPAAGLDPVIRDKFYRQLLQDYETYPRTIILSTHIIDEAEKVFEDVIILKDKNVLLYESVDKILQKGKYLSGSLKEISSIIGEKRIIYQDKIAGQDIIGIYDTLEEWQIQALDVAGVKITPMGLQKTFIYLTEDDYDTL